MIEETIKKYFNDYGFIDFMEQYFPQINKHTKIKIVDNMRFEFCIQRPGILHDCMYDGYSYYKRKPNRIKLALMALIGRTFIETRIMKIQQPTKIIYDLKQYLYLRYPEKIYFSCAYNSFVDELLIYKDIQIDDIIK